MQKFDKLCADLGLSKAALAQASMPKTDDELTAYSYLACRIVPTMPTYVFADIAAADATIRLHNDWCNQCGKQLKLQISSRTDKALELYMLTRNTDDAVYVNPFIFMQNQGAGSEQSE